MCTPDTNDESLFMPIACPLVEDICTEDETLETVTPSVIERIIEGHLNPITTIDLTDRILNPANLAVETEVVMWDGSEFVSLSEYLQPVFSNNNGVITIDLNGDEAFSLTKFALRVKSESCIREFEDDTNPLYDYPEIFVEFFVEAYHCDGQLVSPLDVNLFDIIYGEG